MILDKRVQILSSWCAASSKAAEAVFPPLVTTVPSNKDAAWCEMLESIDAIRLVRMLTMVRSHGGPAPLDLNHVTFADGQVLVCGIFAVPCYSGRYGYPCRLVQSCGTRRQG